MNEIAAHLNRLADVWGAAMWQAVWQGGIALLLVWLVCRAWKTLSPRWQSWLWRLAYLKLLVAFAWFAPLELPLLPESATPAIQQANQVADLQMAGSVPNRNNAEGVTDARFQAAAQPEAYVALTLSSWLLLFWLSGCGWCLARLGVSWWRASRLFASTQPASGSEQEILAELCRLLNIPRVPDMVVSPSLGTPLLAGLIRPRIVVSQQCMGSSNLRLMLAHELAHLKRGDLWWNWLPAMAHALFYFHPLVWLAERAWRFSQEAAADELALLSTDASPSQYGEMLLAAASQLRGTATQATTSLAAVGILESYKSLKARLWALGHIRPLSRRNAIRGAMVLALLAIVGIVPWKVVASDGWIYQYEVISHERTQPNVIAAGQGDPQQCRNAFPPPPVYIGPMINIPPDAAVAGTLTIQRKRNGQTEQEQFFIRKWTDEQGKVRFGCNGPAPQFAHRGATIEEVGQSVRKIFDVRRHELAKASRTEDLLAQADTSNHKNVADAALAATKEIQKKLGALAEKFPVLAGIAEARVELQKNAQSEASGASFYFERNVTPNSKIAPPQPQDPNQPHCRIYLAIYQLDSARASNGAAEFAVVNSLDDLKRFAPSRYRLVQLSSTDWRATLDVIGDDQLTAAVIEIFNAEVATLLDVVNPPAQSPPFSAAYRGLRPLAAAAARERAMSMCQRELGMTDVRAVSIAAAPQNASGRTRPDYFEVTVEGKLQGETVRRSVLLHRFNSKGDKISPEDRKPGGIAQ